MKNSKLFNKIEHVSDIVSTFMNIVTESFGLFLAFVIFMFIATAVLIAVSMKIPLVGLLVLVVMFVVFVVIPLVNAARKAIEEIKEFE